MQKQNLFVTQGGISYAGFNFEDLPLQAALQVAIQQIDQEADRARVRISGDALRVMEQQLAEQQARTYLEQGDGADVPLMVSDYAEVLELEADVAAARLVEQGNAWRDAVQAIRSARLLGRKAVGQAGSHARIEEITDGVFLTIRAHAEAVAPL